MLWFILATITGLSFGIIGFLMKHLAQEMGEKTALFVRYGLSTIILFPVFLLTDNIHIYTNQTFIIAATISLTIDIYAAWLLYKSVKEHRISETLPILSLSPLFTIFWATVFAGETINPTGYAGIILTVMGAYTLNITRKDLLHPLKELINHPGSRNTLIVTLLWSLTATTDAIAVRNSDPFTYVLLFQIAMTIGFIKHGLGDKKINQKIKKNYKQILMIVAASVAMFISQMNAINIANVTYVLPIKRAGIIFSLLLSHKYFEEKQIIKKLTATAIMVSGAALLYMA